MVVYHHHLILVLEVGLVYDLVRSVGVPMGRDLLNGEVLDTTS